MPEQDFRSIKIMWPLCANQMKPVPSDQNRKTVCRMPQFLLNSWPSQRQPELEQGMTRCSLLNDSDLSNNLEFCTFWAFLVCGCECSKDQRLLGSCCRTFTTSRFTNGQLLSTMEGGDSGTVIASHWLLWSQALCLAQRPAFGKSHNLHQWTFRSLQHLVRARMLWAWGRWQGAKSRCCVRRWVKSELLGKQESTDQEHCRVSYIMIWFHFVICMNTCMLQCDSSIPVIFFMYRALPVYGFYYISLGVVFIHWRMPMWWLTPAWGQTASIILMLMDEVVSWWWCYHVFVILYDDYDDEIYIYILFLEHMLSFFQQLWRLLLSKA